MSHEEELSSSINSALPLSAMHAIRGYLATDIGRVRSENQDSAGMTETDKARVYLIADGMGGARGGQKASRLAIDSLSQALVSCRNINPEFLASTLKQINQKINDEALQKPSLKGMGTTLVGLVFTQSGLQVMNVGDSRAYLLRNGQLQRLTDDHTVVAELVRTGVLNEEQARANPISNLLTRSLGANTAVEPDCHVYANSPCADDIYLLCSDGLYRYMDDTEIAQILQQFPAQKGAEQLVNIANERGGEDNITALVVKVDRYLSMPVTRHAMVPKSNDRPRFAESVQVDSSLANRLHTLAPAQHKALRDHEQISTPRLRTANARTVRLGSQALMVTAAFLAGIGLTTYLHLTQRTDKEQTRLPDALVIASNQGIASYEEPAIVEPSNSLSREGMLVDQLTRNDPDAARARLSPGALQRAVGSGNGPVKSQRDLSTELNSVQVQIDTETRKLTTWFIRQRQVEAGTPSALASEIAVSTPSVRQQKQSFDAANWDYLREAETLLYNPADESLEKKVKDLSRLRETRLKELDDGIKLAVRSALDASLAHLFELTTQRDRLQAALRVTRVAKKSR